MQNATYSTGSLAIVLRLHLVMKYPCQFELLTCWIVLRIINSLAPGRFQFNFRYGIFKLTLANGGWGISYEIALRWIPLDLTDDKSTLVQVMAWCRQATSHYLSQCWPRSMLSMVSLGLNELKMYSQFVSYFGFYSTVDDQIHNGTTLHVPNPILSIACLLMPWWLKKPGQQHTWYSPYKPEYSVSRASEEFNS